MRKLFLGAALLAAPLHAQSGSQVLPQLSLDKTGSARTVSVRDPVANTNRPIGTIDASGFNSTPKTVKVDGAQSLAVQGAGNVTSLRSSFVLQATVPLALASVAHAVEVLSLTSNVGFNSANQGSGSADNNNQVTSYRSFVANPGSSDAWVDNILLHHGTNDPINTHGIELDYDMF